MLTSYVALGVTLYILPGRQSSGPLPVLGLVLVVAAVGVLLRPLLLGLAVILGSFGLLLAGVLTQAVILDVAIAIVPNVDIGSRPEILVVSWAAAAIAALVNWLFDAGSQDSFLTQLMGRAVRIAYRQQRGTQMHEHGTLIVQLDGVGQDVIRQAIVSGSVPTLASWIRSGSHTLNGWHTGLPATTPAGQAVLLYGDVSQIPSFRWYEKESSRLMVANRPRDAAEIELRLRTGHGLLAADGVSISNLFCGDAAEVLLTMSDARLPARSTRGLANFATAKGGLVRSIVVFLGSVITELYQGRRQRRRKVLPRVRRGWVFALLRGVTTALLRDLNVALVAEQIARGTPTIFVDFIDYDEVAHHAGPSRPESMRTLDGLDRILRFFADVIDATGREYEIVVLSDHGQAQGATFEQLHGTTLHDLVDDLCSEPNGPSRESGRSDADSAPAERWGPANLLMTGAARSSNRLLRAFSHLPWHDNVTPGQSVESTEQSHQTKVIVAASGSLAHIYLTDEPGRATRQTIANRYPGLIEGLAQCHEIGAVIVRTDGVGDSRALTVLGAGGWRLLVGSAVIGGEGDDPLAAYGPSAVSDLVELDQRHHVGDVIALGRYEPRTGEVVAFEELVGSHGGLGGGQTEAIFIHPSSWPVPDNQVLSGVQVHDVLMQHVPHDADDAVNTFAFPHESVGQ